MSSATQDLSVVAPPPPPPPPSSPPPPSPSPALPSPSMVPPIPQRLWTASSVSSSSTVEEVAAPARLLCRMSIAALVDDHHADAELETSSEGAGISADEDGGSDASSVRSSDVKVRALSRVPTSPTRSSAYTPLTSVTQAQLVQHGKLRRRSALGPHFFDDDFSSSDDSDIPSRRVASPPTKQRKTTKSSTPSAAQRTATKPTAATPSGTLVVYQPTCLDHHNDAHQENRARLTALCGPHGILQKPRFRALQWADLRELRPARLGDLLRVHSFQYIQHLERVCAALPSQTKACTVGAFYADGDAVAPTKKQQHRPKDSDTPLYPNDWMQTTHAQKCYAAANPPSSGHFDNDSPISRRSYDAARLAAGAVCHAVDQVVRGATRNAFVAVRPPGHHAGPNGCVESAGFHRRPEMCTCGFCLLNNVAIGAAYAMATYNNPFYTSHVPTTTATSKATAIAVTPTIQRVAIVDFDIHHGNGTEEILRNLVPHQQPYPLPSSWAPLTFPSYQPWRDERDVDNVFFASIHLHDGDNFYPCSGSGPHGDSLELRDQPNIMNLPLDFIGPRYLEDRERLTVKAKKSLMERASRAFRERVLTRLVPALREFRPDLVLLSAGFDGHADDFYYYLTEADYAWITEQLTQVANECCDGRLVSVLEGGYNVELSAAQKRKLKAKYKGTKRGSNGWTSTSSSPAASPARSTRTEGEDEDDDEEGTPAEGEEEDAEDEQLTYGALARSCAAHVMALQRAGEA